MEPLSVPLHGLGIGLSDLPAPNTTPLSPGVLSTPTPSTPTPTSTPSASAPAGRIIVGIDFGTTHSAVAWAHTSTPDEYEVITQWPGQSGKDWGKVPSDISYNAAARSPTPLSPSLDPVSPLTPEPSADPPFKWGFEVPATDPQKLSWIKILLDPSQPRPTFVNPKRTTLPPGKSPIMIVTDYLRALRMYTQQTLGRRLGPSVLHASPIEYVLTVPAVWSDKARATTLEAAVAAGFGDTLRLITEPEGAAEYALRSLQPNPLVEGDCFTVCDAGGGTVDLITYTILSLQPLQVAEVAVGTGALCGAVYLDRRFEEFVAGVVGQETMDAMDHRAKFQMGQYWETYMKREFTDDSADNADADAAGSSSSSNGVGGEDFWVPVMGVPDSPDGRIRGGFLRISRAEVKAIFHPIVTEVLSLLSAQVHSVLKRAQKPVSAILLVGGFGSSEYLYHRIQQWSAGSIPVLQPRNAWTAVVRGAIIRGLSGDTIAARLSRRYYGVVHDARFDAAKHTDDEKHWHDLRCEWIVRNRIQWYIRRGDVTTSTRTLSFPFYRTISASEIVGAAHSLKTELWVCDGVSAPSKRDASVRKLCVMTSEPVPVSRFAKMRNEKGDVFYRVDYSLDMTVTGGVVVYEMSLGRRRRGSSSGASSGACGASSGANDREKVGRVEVTYE